MFEPIRTTSQILMINSNRSITPSGCGHRSQHQDTILQAFHDVNSQNQVTCISTPFLGPRLDIFWTGKITKIKIYFTMTRRSLQTSEIMSPTTSTVPSIPKLLWNKVKLAVQGQSSTYTKHNQSSRTFHNIRQLIGCTWFKDNQTPYCHAMIFGLTQMG